MSKYDVYIFDLSFCVRLTETRHLIRCSLLQGFIAVVAQQLSPHHSDIYFYLVSTMILLFWMVVNKLNGNVAIRVGSSSA